MIRAPGQLPEAPECLGDLEERILNLVQGWASVFMRVMKLDDCPHSSAPVLLDFPGRLRFAASYPPRGRLGSPATDYVAIRRTLPQGGDNLLSTVWAMSAQTWDICTRTDVLTSGYVPGVPFMGIRTKGRTHPSPDLLFAGASAGGGRP